MFTGVGGYRGRARGGHGGVQGVQMRCGGVRGRCSGCNTAGCNTGECRGCTGGGQEGSQGLQGFALWMHKVWGGGVQGFVQGVWGTKGGAQRSQGFQRLCTGRVQGVHRGGVQGVTGMCIWVQRGCPGQCPGWTSFGAGVHEGPSPFDPGDSSWSSPLRLVPRSWCFPRARAGSRAPEQAAAQRPFPGGGFKRTK